MFKMNTGACSDVHYLWVIGKDAGAFVLRCRFLLLFLGKGSGDSHLRKRCGLWPADQQHEKETEEVFLSHD